MGCVCCSLSSFISILLHSLERITLCTVCALLTCCILFTILSVLVMGIGIGFHYCEVQHSVDAMAAAAKAASALDTRRSGDSRKQQVLRTVNQAVKRGFAHRLSRRDRDLPMPSNNNTVNDHILAFFSNSSLFNATSLKETSKEVALANTTIPELSGFAQRFSKRDLRLLNNSANVESFSRNMNETTLLLKRGFNDTLSLLKGEFIASQVRKRGLIYQKENEVTEINNLANTLNSIAG